LSSVIWPSICNLHCQLMGEHRVMVWLFSPMSSSRRPYPLAGVFALALLTGYIHSMTNYDKRYRSTFKHAMETRSRIKISARLESDSVPSTRRTRVPLQPRRNCRAGQSRGSGYWQILLPFRFAALARPSILTCWSFDTSAQLFAFRFVWLS